jgi:hypothetical protein
MRRHSFVLLLVLVISSLGFALPASASVHPSGSTTCFVTGSGTVNPPLSGSIPSVRPLRSRIKGALSACDDQAIVNSTLPIVSGSFEIQSKLPVGSTCFTLLSNPLAVGKIKLKWRGLQVIDGVTHYKKQGSSTGKIASASVYSENGEYGLRIVSEPIGGSAFAGEIITAELDLGDINTLATACETPGGTIASITINGERIVVAPTEVP